MLGQATGTALREAAVPTISPAAPVALNAERSKTNLEEVQGSNPPEGGDPEEASALARPITLDLAPAQDGNLVTGFAAERDVTSTTLRVVWSASSAALQERPGLNGSLAVV